MSARFSQNFTRVEIERTSRPVVNRIPTECFEIFGRLCMDFLEPIRAHFGGKKMLITSGYRGPLLNSAVGGASDSQHMATANYCAVDFIIPGVPLQDVFDWIRLESGLPFDQVILERGREERHEWDDCIHISCLKMPRRMALVGETGNRGAYKAVEVA